MGRGRMRCCRWTKSKHEARWKVEAATVETRGASPTSPTVSRSHEWALYGLFEAPYQHPPMWSCVGGPGTILTQVCHRVPRILVVSL